MKRILLLITVSVLGLTSLQAQNNQEKKYLVPYWDQTTSQLGAKDLISNKEVIEAAYDVMGGEVYNIGKINHDGYIVVGQYFGVDEYDQDVFAMGMIDESGGPVVELKYQYCGNTFQNGLVEVRTFDDYYGYCNQEGLLAIPAIYLIAYPFSEGLACVNKEGYYGFINTAGETIIPTKYYIANSFNGGLAVVINDDLKYGYINKKGTEVTPLKYSNARPLSGGFGIVSNGELYGVVNRAGKEVCACQYTDIMSFRENRAVISLNNQFGFIDTMMRRIVEPVYDQARSFSEGYATVAKSGKYGFIDPSGKLVVELKYDTASVFSDGMAVIRKDGQWGYIDKSFKEHFFQISGLVHVKDFHEGLAAAKVGGSKLDTYEKNTWGYINKEGTMAIPAQFEYANEFKEGFAKISHSYNEYLINRTGEIVF